MKCYILAIDPGREKTGLAILDMVGNVAYHEIVAEENLVAKIDEALVSFEINTIVLGNGTSSKAKIKILEEHFPDAVLKVVDEYATTEEGKKIYFKMNPPRGWRRLIPVGMQIPPGPIDDYAAIAIGRRFIAKQK